MPRAKSLSHYPSQYLQIVADCSIRGLTVRVRIVGDDALSAKQRALKLRGHFYAFVGALRRTAREAEAEAPLATVMQESVRDLARRVDGVALTLEAQPDGSVDMVWCNRENSWQAQILREASRIEGTAPPVPTQVDASLERLLNLQQEMDKEEGK